MSEVMSLLVPLPVAADRIAAVVSSSNLQLRIDIGRYLAEEMFGGLTSYYQRTDASQHLVDLAKLLSERKVAPFSSAQSLSVAIRTYELDTKLEGLARQWPALSASHFEEVLGLELGEQRRLLDAAAAQTPVWTVKRLEQEVKGVREESASTRVASPKTVAKRLLSRIAELAERPEAVSAALPAAGFAAEETAELVTHLEKAGQLSLALLERLDAGDHPQAEKAEPAQPEAPSFVR